MRGCVGCEEMYFLSIALINSFPGERHENPSHGGPLAAIREYAKMCENPAGTGTGAGGGGGDGRQQVTRKKKKKFTGDGAS